MILKYPVNYIAITGYFKKGGHNGIDLGWSNTYGGQEQPIYAAESGEVVSVRSNYNQTDTSGGSYGNYIKLKHENGFSTLYAHMKYGSVTLKVGDRVNKGDQIGIMGRTGHATGNHLHYEVLINNEKVNPEEYTFVYPDQIISSNPSAIKGLLYYIPVPDPEPTPDPEPDKEIEELKKQIQELQDKISLQAKEIDSLKEQLKEEVTYVFEYPVQKTSLYEIKLYEGETLLIK